MKYEMSAVRQQPLLIGLAQHNAGVNIVLTRGRRDDARAPTVGCCRSLTTKRRTLTLPAAKPCSSTSSCQMAMALRPRPMASAMSSR